MQKIYMFIKGIPRRIKASVYNAALIVGVLSTLMSIAGVSVGDWIQSLCGRVGIIIVAFLMFCILLYVIIGIIYKKEIQLTIRKTPVSIVRGDIFTIPGMKVIGCDNRFDLRVDDKVISKKSLHGQLVTKHANEEELKKTIASEAKRLKICKNEKDGYSFPIGTIIRYESSVDHQTYLLLSMMELDNKYEVHTNMVEYEQMLMKMWHEISRVYAMNDIVIPLLGTGIARFDDGPKEKSDLLRCMLCTLNNSGISLNAKVSIVLYGNTNDMDLYEYKDIFGSLKRGIC